MRIGPPERPGPLNEHAYATTTPLEFDKCCAMWLIRRFIDPNATFKIYPQGIPLAGPRVFDVAGTAWSRQHRRCTSDCIWEDLEVSDAAAGQMVRMAHQVELGRWHLDEFPQAQQCQAEVLRIIQQVRDPDDCAKRTIEYFDAMYTRLRREANNRR